MKNLSALIALIVIGMYFITGCQQDEKQITTEEDNLHNPEIIALQNKIEQLKLENEIKDSLFNTSISYFNEIQDNLLKISIKEDVIRVKSSNPEITVEDKEWILQEMHNINYLREQNAQKVKNLQQDLKNQSFRIVELEATIDRLKLRIKSRDEKIDALQQQLADLDVEYAELFDQYHEQVELALDVLKELNTVYFAYGTMKELEDNSVIERDGGFIGIGKKVTIAEDLKQSYFKTLDKTKVKELKIIGKKPQLITDHPNSSYEWKENRLIIKDPSSFWRISNYLVVSVK